MKLIVNINILWNLCIVLLGTSNNNYGHNYTSIKGIPKC